METPQEEPSSDNDSDQYPEDDIPEEEDDDDEEDEDDDQDDGDYKVIFLIAKFSWRICFLSVSLWSVLHLQVPPTTRTQEKKDDEDGGTMPPYDQETQTLIDGKIVCRQGESVIPRKWVSVWQCYTTTNLKAYRFLFITHSVVL